MASGNDQVGCGGSATGLSGAADTSAGKWLSKATGPRGGEQGIPVSFFLN